MCVPTASSGISPIMYFHPFSIVYRGQEPSLQLYRRFSSPEVTQILGIFEMRIEKYLIFLDMHWTFISELHLFIW